MMIIPRFFVVVGGGKRSLVCPLTSDTSYSYVYVFDVNGFATLAVSKRKDSSDDQLVHIRLDFSFSLFFLIRANYKGLKMVLLDV